MEKQKILQEVWEVDARLISLGLPQPDLVRVVQESVLARNNSTTYDPANAAGWFAWSFGTRALREVFCLKGWKLDRKDGIESIYNEKLNIKVVFQNVDCASDRSRAPKTRSQKGAGSERAVSNNHQFDLFPNYKVNNDPSDTAKIWFLCVSADGADIRAELSLPKSLEDGQFSDFLERIFIVNKGEWDKFPTLCQDNPDNQGDQDFEVNVSRK